MKIKKPTPVLKIDSSGIKLLPMNISFKGTVTFTPLRKGGNIDEK